MPGRPDQKPPTGDWEMPEEAYLVLTLKEEPKFQQWARDHYILGEEIDPMWHPVTRKECRKINKEAEEQRE